MLRCRPVSWQASCRFLSIDTTWEAVGNPNTSARSWKRSCHRYFTRLTATTEVSVPLVTTPLLSGQALQTVKDLENKLLSLEQQDVGSKDRNGKEIRIWMDGAFDMMHYGERKLHFRCVTGLCETGAVGILFPPIQGRHRVFMRNFFAGV
jgi:hypothetical protein